MKTEKGITFMIAVWILGILFNVALFGAIIYVAWHFVSKWW